MAETYHFSFRHLAKFSGVDRSLTCFLSASLLLFGVLRPVSAEQSDPPVALAGSDPRLQDGAVHFRAGDYQAAITYWRSAADMARDGERHLEEGVALIHLARVLHIVGSSVDAMRVSRQALDVATGNGLEGPKCDALANIGMIYRFLGKTDIARNYLDQSLAMARKMDDRGRLAFILNQDGLLRMDQGRGPDAMDCFYRALVAAREAIDSIEAGNSLRYIGAVHLRSGRYDKAQEYIQNANLLAEKTGDKRGLGLSLNQRGMLLSCQGQYEKALRQYDKAMEIIQPLGDISSTAEILSNIAAAYRDIGSYLGALSYSKEALGLYRKAADARGETACAVCIGRVHSMLRETQEAQRYYQLARETSQQAGDRTSEAYAIVYLCQGQFASFRQYSRPLELLASALETFRQAGDVIGEGHALILMGTLHNRTGQHDRAHTEFLRVRDIATGTGHAELLWQAYQGQGYALWKQRRKVEAAEAYSKAIDVVERLYETTAGLQQDRRSLFVGSKRPLYEEFIDLLIDLQHEDPQRGYDQQAFLVAELARSRQFTEMLARTSANLSFLGAEPDFRALMDREKTLLLRLSHSRQCLFDHQSRPQDQWDRKYIQTLQAEIENHEAMLQQLNSEIATRFPRYADLKAPKTTTVQEIQRLLSSHESLLSYFVTSEQMVVFVITPSTFRMLPLFPDRREVRSLVQRFRHGCVSLADVDTLVKAASALYEELFKDAEQYIKEGNTVFVAADDVLYTIPFEALVRRVEGNASPGTGPPAAKQEERKVELERERTKTSQKGGGSYYRPDYLGSHYDLAYLPAATALRSLRKFTKEKSLWSETLVAFADPQFDDTGEGRNAASTKAPLFLQELKRAAGIAGIRRLPETAEEANSVAAILGGKHRIYLRDRASEAVLYEEKFDKTQYLLFSTHGILGGDFTLIAEPALVLSLVGNPPGVDGLLTMSEILGLEFNADIAALSACNTAGETEWAQNGEGFAGLTRSFMYAGTHTLLVSHWPVQSQATVELMKLFFTNLRAGLNKPGALHKAQSMLRSEYSHPYYWAPFVLVGETD